MLKLMSIVLVIVGFSFTAQADKKLEAKYMRSCKACHTTKVPKAPQTGDKKAWDATFKAAGGGKDAMKKLVASVKKGKGGMPAKGLCMDCTDAEFEGLINYMKNFKK